METIPQEIQMLQLKQLQLICLRNQKTRRIILLENWKL